MIDTLEYFDTQLFLFLNSKHLPLVDVMMFNISKVWVFFPLFFYWIFLLYQKFGLKKIATIILFIAVLVAITDQTTNRIKHGVKRYRPTHNLVIGSQVHTVNEYRGGQYGFFSGHSSNTFAVAMFLFLIFSNKSILFRAVFFIWAAIVAYSRIYLGVHYPSDIFVGMFVGIFLGYIVFLFTKKYFKKKLNEDLVV
jgi:undecaprenyl-diphosphatase